METATEVGGDYYDFNISAGMPPAYIFRAGTLKVEEICLEGMPLGAMADFPYRILEDQLSSGDTLLLLSDRLVDAGEVWRKTELPDDDVTLMVLRAK